MHALAGNCMHLRGRGMVKLAFASSCMSVRKEGEGLFLFPRKVKLRLTLNFPLFLRFQAEPLYIDGELFTMENAHSILERQSQTLAELEKRKQECQADTISNETAARALEEEVTFVVLAHTQCTTNPCIGTLIHVHSHS